MRSSVLRAAGKVVMYLAIVGVVLGAFAIHSPDAFAQIPPEKREDLVGDWYADRYGSFRRYIFKEDGTGEIIVPGRDTRKFFWGTEGDQLRMKYKTQNGWSAPLYEVNIGDEANLKAVENGYSMQLKREAPKSALIQ